LPLILLLSVAFIRRKLLKTTYTEELENATFIQIQEAAIYDSDHKKQQFNFQQIIQIIQPKVIDYFSTHSYIVFNIRFVNNALKTLK